MLTREEVVFESPPVKLPVGFAKNGVKLNNSSNVNRNMVNHNNNNVVRMTEVRTPTGACIKYVCSKVTLYYNSRIELKWRRALHHCQSCDFGVGLEKGESVPCGAIHYGMCLPVVDKYSVPHSRTTRVPVARKPVVCSPAVVPGARTTVSSQAVSAVYPPTSPTSPKSPSHTPNLYVQVCNICFHTLYRIVSPYLSPKHLFMTVESDYCLMFPITLFSPVKIVLALLFYLHIEEVSSCMYSVCFMCVLKCIHGKVIIQVHISTRILVQSCFKMCLINCYKAQFSFHHILKDYCKPVNEQNSWKGTPTHYLLVIINYISIFKSYIIKKKWLN